MSNVIVDFNRLKQVETQFKATSKNINRIQETIQLIIAGLDWDVKFQDGINSSANEINRKLRAYTRTLNNYERYLDTTHTKYKNLDVNGENGFEVDRISTAAGGVSGGGTGGGGGGAWGVQDSTSATGAFPIGLIGLVRPGNGFPGSTTVVSPLGSVADTLYNILHGKDKKTLKRVKDLLSKLSKLGDVKGAGRAKSALTYFENLIDFVNGPKSGATGAAQWCNLVNGSTGIWNALSEYLTGDKNTGLSLIGSGFSTLGSFFSAASHAGNQSDAATIADFIEAFGKIGDIGSKYSNATVGSYYSPLGVGAAWWQLGTGIVSQTAKSVDKYMADGHWSFNDTVSTAMEVSANGVYHFGHAVLGDTFDAIIGAYNPQDFIDNLYDGVDLAAHSVVNLANKITSVFKK